MGIHGDVPEGLVAVAVDQLGVAAVGVHIDEVARAQVQVFALDVGGAAALGEGPDGGIVELHVVVPDGGVFQRGVVAGHDAAVAAGVEGAVAHGTVDGDAASQCGDFVAVDRLIEVHVGAGDLGDGDVFHGGSSIGLGCWFRVWVAGVRSFAGSADLTNGTERPVDANRGRPLLPSAGVGDPAPNRACPPS